jgi:hypothetical protein
VLALWEWNTYLFNSKPQPELPTAVAILALIYVSFKIVKLRKELAALRLGQEGERAVGEELQILQKNGSAVLHDVVGDKFNIDHVVISTHGVFVVETKTYSKPDKKNSHIYMDGEVILVDGKPTSRDPIAQTRALSKWLQKLIQQSTGKTFYIKPVILFPGWFVEPIKNSKDLWVLNPKALPIFIDNEPETISESDLHLITYHLSRYIRTHESS